jgi:cytochrome P450
MGFDWALNVLPYGERWRQSRKLLHGHVHPGVVPTYEPIQLASARRLVVDLIHAEHNKNILPHIIKTNFGAATIKMVYGIDVKGNGDKYMATPEKVIHAITVGTVPGRFLVDVLPFCSWFLLIHRPSTSCSYIA